MNQRGRTLAALGFLFLWPRSAGAQTPELDRARATFTEALADEQAGRNEVALEKFQHVAAVRDTAQVEYRIASCLEALGRLRAALRAYDRAARLGRADAQAADVASAANARTAALGAEMGTLAITVHGGDAPDVRVDGEPIAPGDRDAVVLEPGDHVVDVSAPHDRPAHANVTIAHGGRLQLTVDLVREEPPAPIAPPAQWSHVRRDIGIVSIAAGAAFAIGAGVMLVVRNDLIDSIHAMCPGDVCPSTAHDDVENKRATASGLEAPAAALGAVALAAVVCGVVLVALGPQRRVTAAIVPSDRGAAFFVRGFF